MKAAELRLRAAEGLDEVPGLVAGITLRASERGGPDDFGLTTGGSAWQTAERYLGLAEALGFRSVAVARQVHGADLIELSELPRHGLWIAGKADGLVGSGAGALFVVTVADCVPVYLVEPESGAFALVHAGWRSAAAGILDHALDRLFADGRKLPASLRMHLGPAICGDCYEVGPEVPRAFGRVAAPDAGRTTFDLRDELVEQAVARGVQADGITRSPLCTRCDGDRLHSHRGAGERAGRMAAYMGWRA